jgi:hypothetical protein
LYNVQISLTRLSIVTLLPSGYMQNLLFSSNCMSSNGEIVGRKWCEESYNTSTEIVQR